MGTCREINDGRYVIYCPKCKFEKRVSKIKWREMKIDKEYKEKINGNV